ncbi:MAG: hypothetical protein MK135_07445 [Polyangiaceae bacterium]|nr:hypothetical protein [Polyangiaceae bacterium]
MDTFSAPRLGSVFILALGLSLSACSVELGAQRAASEPNPSGDNTVNKQPDGSNTPNGPASGGSGNPNQPNQQAGSWKELHACASSDPQDPIDINRVELFGDELIVVGAHAGGCEMHAYGLCFEPNALTAEPVELELKLLHESNGDSCEAYLSTDELRFDLSMLKEKYGSAPDSLLISLGEQTLSYPGEKDDDQSLLSWEEIDAKIAQANYCESVDDCQGISTRPCETAYVNGSSAELMSLNQAISERLKADGDEFSACPAICACGLLTCEQNRCTTATSDCSSFPTGAAVICL